MIAGEAFEETFFPMEYASESYSDKIIYTVIYAIGNERILSMKISIPNDSTEDDILTLIKMTESDSSSKLIASGVALLTIFAS